MLAAQTTRQRRRAASLGVAGDGAAAPPRRNCPRPMNGGGMAAGRMTGNDTSMVPGARRHLSCPRYGHGWRESALICKSRDDLVRYQTQIANGSSATTPGQAPDCHTIRNRRVSRFCSRRSSRTQIVTTDEPEETCWTNRMPGVDRDASVAKAARRRGVVISLEERS